MALDEKAQAAIDKLKEKHDSVIEKLTAKHEAALEKAGAAAAKATKPHVVPWSRQQPMSSRPWIYQRN